MSAPSSRNNSRDTSKPSAQSSNASGGSSSRSGGGQKADAKEVALLQMDVRDSWLKAVGKTDVLQSGHDTFVQWIMGIFKQQLLDSHPSVQKYLEYFLKDHPSNFLANPGHVHTLLKENKNARTYRVSAVCHAAAINGDNRLRSLVEYIFTDSSISFSIYTLYNEFFTHFLAASHTSPKSTFTIYGTKQATNFERVLLVCFLAEEGTLHSRTEKSFKLRKRKFKELDSPDKFFGKFRQQAAGSSNNSSKRQLFPPCFLPQFLKKDASSSQRSAKVIQTICRGWSLFAQHLYYTDIDEMVQPYIWYGGSPLRAHVLENRSDGYMPLESAKRIVVDEKPVIVTQHTFPHVTEYSSEVDTFLRELALEFINDIRRGVFSANLYRKDHVIFERKYDNYQGTPDSLPKRFGKYIEDDARFTQLRTSRRAMLGILDPVPQAGGSNLASSSQTVQQDVVMATEDITPRRIPSVSPIVYKKRKDATEAAKLLLNTTTAPSIEAEREKLQSFFGKDFVMYSSSYDQLETLLLTDQVEHDVFGSTQFVCIDPPYNTRRMAGKGNSAHDRLSEEEMPGIVQLIDQLLRNGGHAVVFCTAQQFVQWQTVFERYKRLGDRGGTPFSVDKAPMVFVNSPSNHKTNPGRSSCALQGMAEFALHVKKNGLNFEEEARMVNYKCFNYVQSSFDGRKNVLDNIPAVSGREVLTEKVAQTVVDEEDPEYGTVSTKVKRVRPEQKSIQLLKELICRFSQPGDIIVDFFAGTFSTAMASFMLPEHRKFVGCELDDSCFHQAKAHFTAQFAHFLVNVESVTDIVVPDDILLTAARVSLSAGDTSPITDPNWKAPDGLPKFQRFPLHIFSKIVATTGNHRHLVDHFKSSFEEWPQEMKQTLDKIPVQELISVEAAAYNVYLAPSLIRHPNSGMGLFASKPFDQGDTICFYYGTLVYTDLSKHKSKTKRYGDTGIMGVSVERFNHYAIQARSSGQAFGKVTDYRYGDRCLFIVPPPFCVGRYMNDYRYDNDDLDRPANGDVTTVPNARTPNVAIKQIPTPVSSVEKLRDTDFLPVVALRPIYRGEELYVNYDRADFAK